MKKSIFLFFAAILCATSAWAAKERVYFVNTPGWTKVNVYAWTDGGASLTWPGTAATKDSWQWNGKDVYYYEAEAGTYKKCIFNNGSGKQSADLTWTANSVYANEAGKWTPVEIAKATTNGTKVYFVNTEKWTTIKVYAFSFSPKDTKNAAWPGANATKESDKVGEYDVYSFTMNKEYDYCIFTNGASSNTKQTADLVVMDGADKYYCKDDWYTKEEAIAKLVAPIEYETVYFVNAADWTGTISAYAYTPVQNASWPGEPAAKEDYQIGGKNVYSYTAEKGKYKNVIFSGTGGQTADLTWTAGKYYVRDNWYTKEEAEAKLAVPVVDVYTIVGSDVLLGTAWDLNNADNEMTKQDDGSYVLVKENVDLAKTGTYEYKVVKNHDWAWSVPSGSTNKTLKLGNEDVDGTYNVTFTLNKELNALTASLELVEAKKVIPECYVAGDESLTGQNWNAKSIQMIYDEATEIYTATLTAVPAGTHNMKVVYGGEWLGFDHLATPAPANVKEGDDKKIQFTLAEAGDVTVTYHATNGIGLTGNFVVPETKYYIAGTENLTGFDWKVNGLEMTKDGDVYKHTFTELNAGTYQFKITDGQWNSDGDNTHEHTTLGATYKEVSINEGNIKIVTGEVKDITVIFDGSKITFEGLTEIEDYYTVVGVAELFGTAWDRANETNKMAKQGDGSYKLVKENVTLAAIGYDWKIAKNGDWWDDAAIGVNPSEGNNILTITTAGRYNVTFTLAADLTSATVETELLEAAVVIPDCYISGNDALTGGAGWAGNEFTMVYDEATETWSYTLAGLQPEKEYALKVVCGGSWLGYDKLQTVPAGVAEGNDNAIAFKIAEAGDVTVTYNVEAGITISGNFYVAPTYDYYIAGTLAGAWSATQQGMIKDGDVYKHTFSELAAGTYEFKITDGQWNTEEDKTHEYTTLGAAYEEVSYNEGNIKIVTEEAINLTVIFDGSKITFEGLTEKAPAVVTYVLMGVGGWDQPGIELVQNPDPEKASEYMLTCQAIAATDAVKVVKCEDGVAVAWYGSVKDGVQVTVNYDADGNIQLPVGTYNFYFDSSLDDKQLWIEAATYTRTATPGSFSTICLPYAGTISGATLFNLSDRDANYVYVVEAGTELEAGKPYVILPTADEIVVTYKNYDKVDAGSYNALYGTYDEMNSDQLDGKYVIAGDKYYYVDKVQSAGSKLLANRAYFNLNELPEVAPVLPVGARRIALGTNGQNTATGMENVDASAQPIKTIINGQLYILRGEKMYDAQGKLVK